MRRCFTVYACDAVGVQLKMLSMTPTCICRQRERLVRDFYKPTPDAALRRLGNEEDRRLSADVISTVTKKAVVKEEVLPEGYSRGMCLHWRQRYS